MKLSELLREVECEGRYEDAFVTGVTDDSRKVKEGYVFVCIKHRSFDGHAMALNAVKNGACAVVSQTFLGVKNEVTVKDTRFTYSRLCSLFDGERERDLSLFAVTGTNGKTTTAGILKAILDLADIKCGQIGTVENVLGDMVETPEYTTPKPPELFRDFRLMAQSGCSACVLEASSQALEQGRLLGLNFEQGIFTNITSEHLDYHKSFQNYLSSKLRLFKNCKKAIVNFDDAQSEKVIKASKNAVTYSVKSDFADYTAKNIRLKEDSVSYELVSKEMILHIEYHSLGLMSVYNSMAAACAALEFGVGKDTVKKAISEFKGVEGRLEKLSTPTDFSIYIDYAHTPDSLEQTLRALKGISKNKVTVVFGCGGDRDKEKRPKMCAAACKYADRVVVTSDNPRTEEPREIISEILKGKSKGTKLYMISDRREAIKKGITLSKKDDILLLAGKGHEKYQIIGKEKFPFDEREEVMKALTEAQIMQGDDK